MRIDANDDPFQAVSDMYFNHTERLNLITTLIERPNLTHYDIACMWMRNNRKTWNYWNQENLREVKILGIFPLDSAYSGEAIADAANLAVAHINEDKSVLRDMRLVLMIRDGKCDSESVINSFIQTVLANDDFQKTIGILGA